jgi:RNA polymerase sigma-70 factor (ECF subfamily)
MRVAYYITGSVEDAEDVLQDMFLGLPTALARYTPEGKFDRWLNRVAARVALSRVRHRGSRAEVDLSEALPAGAENHGDTLEQMQVGDAVRALPDNLRAVFVLKVVEGYSHAETAATLGISVAASQMRLSRAFRQLQKDLTR